MGIRVILENKLAVATSTGKGRGRVVFCKITAAVEMKNSIKY